LDPSPFPKWLPAVALVPDECASQTAARPVITDAKQPRHIIPPMPDQKPKLEYERQVPQGWQFSASAIGMILVVAAVLLFAAFTLWFVFFLPSFWR